MLTINPPTHFSKNGRSNIRSFLLAALHLGMVLEARVRGSRYHTPHSKLN
ncbi:hypothetical protein CROQUDRAFT_652434 [Cronartium quercuum f. sp. fusiforme G11]|uniref:Uncharacterized protein n=1 Tax=Cronartium quercuum f. sp. fusiforme G11 TaxID=708437 RepID=A0A9P6NNR0_9BASI|nr:hypothetical protein CROQUDRAFT_652434 [Cronartium quercuum f. sp. fusiforme G11]